MSLEMPLEVFVRPKQRQIGRAFTAHAAIFEGDGRIHAIAMPDGILIGCIWFPDLDVAAQRLQSQFPDEWIWSEPIVQLQHKSVDSGGRLREIVLEPILAVIVTTPPDFVGNVIGDLSSRRALITGQTEVDGWFQITAEAPLAELARYAGELSRFTEGKATASATFLKYQQRPTQIGPPPDEPMSAALRA